MDASGPTVHIRHGTVYKNCEKLKELIVMFLVFLLGRATLSMFRYVKLAFPNKLAKLEHLEST